jgi:hypothetical protein
MVDVSSFVEEVLPQRPRNLVVVLDMYVDPEELDSRVGELRRL